MGLEVVRYSAFGLNKQYHGEFDPGSERTLAARLKHASRAAVCSNAHESGGLVSSAWVTYLEDGDSR